MKKFWMIQLAIVLVISICTVGVVAAQANRRGNFVDTDGDGICDNRGQNFVDADGDGICDNRGEGKGQGRHHGNGRGCC